MMKHMRKIKKLIVPAALLSVATIFLVGCASHTYPVRHQFVLQAADATRMAQTPLPATLEIETTVANAPYHNNTFVYQLKSNQYSTDFYDVFFTDPATLITQNLSRNLKEIGLFNTVATTELQLPATYVLKSQLLALNANYSDNNNPTADMSLRVILMQDQTIVIDQTYTRATKLSAKTTDDLVQAWNSSLTDILKQLDNELYQKFYANAHVQKTAPAAVVPVEKTQPAHFLTLETT